MIHPADVISAIKHTIYVDVVGGTPLVPLNRAPSPTEIFNDRDLSLLKFFAAITDPQCLSLAHYIDRDLTPQHLDIHLHNYYQRVRRVLSTGFQKHVRDTNNERFRPLRDACNAMAKNLPMLEKIVSRLAVMDIETEPYDIIFDEHDSPDTVFFVNLDDRWLAPDEIQEIFYRAQSADGVVLFYAKRLPDRHMWPFSVTTKRGCLFSRHPQVIEAIMDTVFMDRNKNGR